MPWLVWLSPPHAHREEEEEEEEANTARRHRHVGGLGGSAGDGEGGESRGQDCRGSRPGGAGRHGTIEKVGRRRLASQRSSCARGKSRPVEAPCAPLPPSGFEPVAFAAWGKRRRHRTIRRSRFCWPANWRDISTWLVLHCSAHAEAATFGQLGLQLENGLVRSSYRCAVRWCWLRAAWASGASERAAWRWRCCWPSGARVALASQPACT